MRDVLPGAIFFGLVTLGLYAIDLKIGPLIVVYILAGSYGIAKFIYDTWL